MTRKRKYKLKRNPLIIATFGTISYLVIVIWSTWKDPLITHNAIGSKLQPHPYGYWITLISIPIFILLYFINNYFSSDDRYEDNRLLPSILTFFVMFAAFLISLRNFQLIGVNGKTTPLHGTILIGGAVTSLLTAISAYVINYGPEYLSDNTIPEEYLKIKIRDFQMYISIVLGVIITFIITISVAHLSDITANWEPSSARLQMFEIFIIDTLALSIVILGIVYPLIQIEASIEKRLLEIWRSK